MQTAGRVAADLNEDSGVTAQIDVIGLDADVVNRLTELHKKVVGINVSERSSDPEQFSNQRAEHYWHLRKLFERGQIMIPDDDELIVQLTALKYKIKDSSGTIAIEEKAKMKERIGVSPDKADSLMLAFAVAPERPSFDFLFIDEIYLMKKTSS